MAVECFGVTLAIAKTALGNFELQEDGKAIAGATFPTLEAAKAEAERIRLELIMGEVEDG